MSRTIKAIERHMILPVGLGPKSRSEATDKRERKLVVEWERSAGIVGRTQRKLRLAFAPMQSSTFATLSR